MLCIHAEISSEELGRLSYSEKSLVPLQCSIPTYCSISTLYFALLAQIVHISSKILSVAMEIGPSSPQEPSTTAIVALDELSRSLSITSWEFLDRTSLGQLDAYPEH